MATPEKALIKQIKHYLTLQSNLGNLTFNRITTTGKVYGNGPRQKFIPNTDMKGYSDFELLANGNVGYMEVKAKKGIISEAQLLFLNEKSKHGAKVGVVFSLDDAILFTEQLLKGDLSSVGIGTSKGGGSGRGRTTNRLFFPQGSFWIRETKEW
jgi:hypothetical protein